LSLPRVCTKATLDVRLRATHQRGFKDRSKEVGARWVLSAEYSTVVRALYLSTV
jgi:hypothetical protein